MKITRVIALSLAASVICGAAVQAESGPPAEFPPTSYKGKQYVDSQGCVFIRAGIDGNVTWVPRVSRSRKQLCGQQPTAVAGATSAPTQSGPAPELITLPTSQQPTAPTPARPATAVASTTAPTTPAPTKPQRPSTAAASVRSTPAPVKAPKPAPQPVAAAPVVQAPVAQAPVGCANASALSQQYINKGARCGPQAESPVTYGNGSGPQSLLHLSPNTRIVPTHVYQSRRHSQALTAPAGYRSVWEDDRLNLHRAERGLKPAVISGRVEVPEGYVLADRDDDRFNTQRALRTAAGDAQTDMIWTRTVPRRLVEMPLDRAVITLPITTARSQAEAEGNLVLRLSTRSAPATVQASAAPHYVRAATYADPAAARDAAQRLAAKGLPVRLGSVTRKGQVYKVVLAGPFGASGAAETALAQVRAAGYSGARISN